MEKMEKITQKRKLDVTNCSQSVWLVKIPQLLYEKWETCQTGETLGTLNISGSMKEGKLQHQLTIKLKEEENLKLEEIIIADEYTMDETSISNQQQIIAFDYDENKQRFSIKGRISKRYTLRAKQNEKYQQIIRNRTNAAQQVKQAKMIDNAETILSSFEPKQIDFIPPAYVDDRKRNSEIAATTKKGRGGGADISEVRQSMISAFGLRDYLTFKEIKSCCRSAAESDLRELLRQYTVYHQKGPLKNYYALKPEYRGGGGAASLNSSIS